MKHIIALCVIFSGYTGFAQHHSLDSAWRRNLERNFNVPDSVVIDSCYYSYSLLRIDLNKSSNISLSRISENTPEWIKNEFKRIEKEGILLLEENARKANFGNCTLIIPIVIRVETSECHYGKYNHFITDKYYQFPGKRMKDIVYFLNPFEVRINR